MKKVYVVEDNEKNMKVFTMVLKTIPDVEIISENRGDRGLEIIKSGKPDLVILDLQLPGLSGIEIFKELRKIKKFNKVPIIAVTAFAMKGDEERIMKIGFDKYISKPIRVKEFKEVVVDFLK
ncbi:MAG: response regulator [Candidatus Hodarchaeota archaeon]